MGSSRGRENMYMVRHQDVRMNIAALLISGRLQAVEIEQMIVGFEKSRLGDYCRAESRAAGRRQD